MFNDKDFMGGMFDFDGNGKTTLDEQYVAYKIYEETTKEENKENDSDSFSYKSTSYNRKPVKPTNPINVTVHKTIPEWMTLKEYKTEKMKNPEFKKAYDKMKPEMKTIRANIDKNISFSPKKSI